MNIEELAKETPGVEEEAAKAFAQGDVLLLTNRDVDSLNDEQLDKYKDYFPLRTGTYVELDGKKAKITEEGKTVEKEVPESSGWYEQDEFGMPFGKPSRRSNPRARYLSRINKWKGLVVRWYVRWDGGDRRGVYCDDRPDVRFGVLGKRVSKLDEKTKEQALAVIAEAKKAGSKEPTSLAEAKEQIATLRAAFETLDQLLPEEIKAKLGASA